MKEILKLLYDSNRKCFNVWNYLWLQSDKDSGYDFVLEDLIIMADVPRTTLLRMVNDYDKFNTEKKTFIELQSHKLGKKTEYHVKFHFNGIALKKKQELAKIEEQLFINIREYLVDFYKRQDYEYPSFNNHFPVAKTIMNKLIVLMKKKGTVINDQTKLDNFMVIFERLPEWWVSKKIIGLNQINKHFDKIINDIRPTTNDKYNKVANGSEPEDFSHLTN
jgi:hypothetical protein